MTPCLIFIDTFRIGNLEKAEACYRSALSLNSEDPSALNNLAIVVEGRGDVNQAIALYEKALALRPSYTNAAINLAGLLMDKGHFRGAIYWCMKVLDAHPDSSAAHNIVASALASDGKLDEAEIHFKKAMGLAPDDVMIRCNYAILLGKQQRHKEAVFHLSEAIRIRPDDAQPYRVMAGFLKNQGNDRQAEKFLKIARQISSTGHFGNLVNESAKPERVNENETRGQRNYAPIFCVEGGLIQTASGSLAGAGILCLNRLGCFSKAAARTSSRRPMTSFARP